MATKATRAAFLFLAAGLVSVAACSGGSDGADTSVPTPTTTPADAPSTAPAAPLTPATDDSSDTTTTSTVPDGPLADVCPSTISVQTAGLPSVGTGPLYELLGTEPSIEGQGGSVSGPLVRPDGTVDDVVLEIRSGGPLVDFRSPVDLLIDDPSLSMAHTSLPVLLRDRGEQDVSAVASLTARSHDAVVVDPATYPDIDSWSSLADSGVVVRHLSDAPVIDFLAEVGAVSPGQPVDGFDGEPAAFVSAGGAIAQQGDLLVEPVLYPTLPQWGRPVEAIAASDAGWLSLDDLVVTSDDRLSDDCLSRLIPIVQSAVVAYVDDPTPTNAVMAFARSTFNPLSRLTVELFDAGTRTAVDLGVFDVEAGDEPVAGFDVDALDDFLPGLVDLLGVDAVDIDEIVDDRFLGR